VHKVAEVVYPRNGSSNVGDARRLGAEQKIDCAATCCVEKHNLALTSRLRVGEK
jgi:hypothetical protein